MSARRWLSLFELDFGGSPAVVKRYSMTDVSAPDYHYDPYVDSISDVVLGIPHLPGLPIVSNMRVVLKNHTLEFSQLFALYSARGVTGRYLIGRDGDAISTFVTHFTGKVVGPKKIDQRFCILNLKSMAGDLWKQPIANDISAIDFPNLPPISPPARANIIIGTATSVGKTDQGAVVCPYVDTVDHLYLVARHRCKEIVNVYVLGSNEALEYEVVEYTGPSGRVYTLLRFPEDIEDPDKTATEFAVAADVSGLFDESSPGDEHLLENAAEAFRRVGVDFIGHNDLSDFNEDMYAEAYADLAAANFVAAGVINWEGLNESIVEEFQKSQSLEVFIDSDNLICMHLFHQEESEITDPEINAEDHIQLDPPLSIDGNDEVINAIAARYDRDATNESFLKEPPVIVNLASQRAVGMELREDLPMRLVSDDFTALRVASTRMRYSDEGIWITTFQLSLPQIPEGVGLARRFLLSHPTGLSATKEGWILEPFRLLSKRYLTRGTPKIEFSAMSLRPGPTAYQFLTPPINVENLAVTETSVGHLVVTWDMPTSSPSLGPDPENILLFFRRSEDPLNSVPIRYAGKVAAADGTATFEALYSESTSLVIYAMPESADGVRLELADSANIVHSARTKISTISSLFAYPDARSVVLRWNSLTDPDDLAMFRNFEVWRNTVNNFATATRIHDYVLPNVVAGKETFIDSDLSDFEGPTQLYYWVLARTIYGVASVESNVVSPVAYPYAVAGFVYDFDVVADGDTFKASWSATRDATAQAHQVTNATNTTPIRITTALPHNHITGEQVYNENITGNTAANGLFRITRVSATEYDLDGSVGNGAFIDGGTSAGMIPVWEIAHYEIAYRAAAWVNEYSPDDGDVTRVLLPGGLTEKDGKLADSTLYWAIRARVTAESSLNPPSTWTRKTASVTTGAEVSYVHVDRQSHYGAPEDPVNDIAFDLDSRQFVNPPWAASGSMGRNGYTPITCDGVNSDFALLDIANLDVQPQVFEDGLQNRIGVHCYLASDSPVTQTRIYFTADDGTTPRVPAAGILVNVYYAKA